MYKYQSDLLINQQKNRKIPDNINKYHWATEPYKTKKRNFFFLSNQNTIDLRLFKLMLRKIKKKLLRLKLKAFVYIIPNKKASYKTKNSRMGKGKGMNNRFYYRIKKTKPSLIFINLNIYRYLKLKLFLSKHFNYKYY